MPDFTPEQKRAYLAGGGTCCPACASTNLVTGDLEAAHGAVYQEVRCHGCGLAFTDVYELVDAQTDELPETPAADPAGMIAATAAREAQPS